jgi:FG-GAP-like repeat
MHVSPRLLTLLALLLLAPSAYAADFPSFKAQQIDPHVGNVCYAVTTADVDGDGKLDAVAVAEDAVYWYANPTWEKHTIIKNATERDNVCLQAHDIDGDGRVDFALGASWQPANTKTGGTIQWLRRTDPKGAKPWDVVPIGAEPTTHRMRWGDVMGTGKKQLVVAPLQGRDTKGPNWGEGNGSRILVYSVPTDPNGAWKSEVAEDSLHTTHNLQLIDLDADGKDEIVIAGWEGVFILKRSEAGSWSKIQIGSGNQETKPFKGSSEVKVGSLANGRRYIATIEPWHGHQVVVYTAPIGNEGLWDRQVIDEPVQWGHAVWCADLDNDGDDELIIGQRDANKDAATRPKGPGVFVYDPTPKSLLLAFTRHTIDDGGIGCEDLVAADLNGDGRADILAGGRSTHNVKIYWNEAK